MGVTAKCVCFTFVEINASTFWFHVFKDTFFLVTVGLLRFKSGFTAAQILLSSTLGDACVCIGVRKWTLLLKRVCMDANWCSTHIDHNLSRQHPSISHVKLLAASQILSLYLFIIIKQSGWVIVQHILRPLVAGQHNSRLGGRPPVIPEVPCLKMWFSACYFQHVGPECWQRLQKHFA